MTFDKKVELLRSEIREEIEAVKTGIKSGIEVVNQNLGNIEGKMVSVDDGMGNVTRDVGLSNKAMKLMKSELKADSESLKEEFNQKLKHVDESIVTMNKAWQSQSQNLEEKVNSNFSQLGNEIVTLKTEMKECSKNFSNEISEIKNSVSDLTTLFTSLATKLKKIASRQTNMTSFFRQKMILKKKFYPMIKVPARYGREN